MYFRHDIVSILVHRHSGAVPQGYMEDCPVFSFIDPVPDKHFLYGVIEAGFFSKPGEVLHRFSGEYVF